MGDPPPPLLPHKPSTMSTPPTPTVPQTKSRTGLAWQEFNSLPPTPPPVMETKVVKPPVASPPVQRPPVPGKPKGLVALAIAGAVAIGVIAGVVVFGSSGKPAPQKSLPGAVAPKAAAPTPAQVSAAPKAVVVPVVPAGDLVAQPGKRRVEKAVVPAPAWHVGAKVHPAKTVASRGAGVSDTSVDDNNVVMRTDPTPAPATGPVEDYGMDLQRPTRRPNKKIDETDPYAP